MIRQIKTLPVRYHIIIALTLSLICISVQASNHEPNMRNGDSYIYLGIAKDLVDKGVFTNANFGGKDAATGEKEQGHFFSPLYPFLVSLVMRSDKGFYQNTQCHLQSKNSEQANKCGHYYKSLINIQIVLNALCAFSIWLGAFLLTKNLAISWLSLFLGLLSVVYGEFAASILTESLVFPLVSFASIASIIAWQNKNYFKKTSLFWILSGALFGLAALTRPSYSYLIYVSVFFLFFASIFLTKHNFIKSFAIPLALLLGFALSVSPWIIRNGLTTGHYIISEGYGPYILIQRIAYNDMTPQEWRASFIYHLPDFGDKLAKDIFSEKATERFVYGNPEGFFAQGHNQWREKISNEVSDKTTLLSHVIKKYIIADLSTHIAVTIALLFNGLWIAKYWGLISIPLFGAALIKALKQKWESFIVYAFPSVFMLGFHAFTSVNVTRYNIPMVPSISLGAAWIIITIYLFFFKREPKT